MLGSALRARQEQRARQRPSQASQGSAAALAETTSALTGFDRPPAGIPGGTLAADAVLVSDEETPARD
eukprot:5615327-Amphidinium_carterae.1